MRAKGGRSGSSLSSRGQKWGRLGWQKGAARDEVRAGKKGTAVQRLVEFSKFLMGRLQFCLKLRSKAYLEKKAVLFPQKS